MYTWFVNLTCRKWWVILTFRSVLRRSETSGGFPAAKVLPQYSTLYYSILFSITQLYKLAVSDLDIISYVLWLQWILRLLLVIWWGKCYLGIKRAAQNRGLSSRRQLHAGWTVWNSLVGFFFQASGNSAFMRKPIQYQTTASVFTSLVVAGMCLKVL